MVGLGVGVCVPTSQGEMSGYGVYQAVAKKA
jgi:hypothetical protein